MARIRCPLEESASVSPDRPALLAESETMSFAQMNAEVKQTALRLMYAGVRPRDTVLIWMSPCPEMCVLLMGLIRLGAVACPLNTRQPLPHISEAARRSGATVLITRRADSPGPQTGTSLLMVEELAGFVDGSDRHPLLVRHTLDQPAVRLFTGGSTGEPKLAELSYGALYYAARGVNAVCRLRSGDIWLLSLPLYHVSGIGVLFRCLLAGACVAIAPRSSEIGEALDRWQPTHISLVPTQLQRLLAEPEAARRGASLRWVMMGGAALSDALREEARRLRWPVGASYGLTEMAGAVTAVPPLAPPEHRRSNGRPLAGREVRLDTSGQIMVRGATLFSGYCRDGQLERVLDEEGWFATGDRGAWDEHGGLMVTGRLDHMFISGGENIHPETIEQALLKVEGVLEAIVLPVPDPEFGRRPVAFIRGTENPPDGEHLASALRQSLPGYMVPTRFFPWPFPEGEGIKINRQRFEELLNRVKL